MFSSLTRGYGQTTAVSHSSGAVIKHVYVAEDARLAYTHVHSAASDHTQTDYSDLANPPGLASGSQDGLMSSTDWNKLDGIELNAKDDLTGAEIVTLLNGLSQPIGLNVDQVDGRDDTYFATSGHDHAGVYSPTSHDHDSDYSDISHDHSGVYSPTSHDHDSDYAPVTADVRFGGDTHAVNSTAAAMTTTLTTKATVTFTKPGTWTSYDIVVMGAATMKGLSGGPTELSCRVAGGSIAYFDAADGEIATVFCDRVLTGQTGNLTCALQVAEANGEGGYISSSVHYMARRAS